MKWEYVKMKCPGCGKVMKRAVPKGQKTRTSFCVTRGRKTRLRRYAG